MNLDALTDDQLVENLRLLLQRPGGDERQIDTMQAVLQSLQVHRVELEMPMFDLLQTEEPDPVVAELPLSDRRSQDNHERPQAAALDRRTAIQNLSGDG